MCQWLKVEYHCTKDNPTHFGYERYDLCDYVEDYAKDPKRPCNNGHGGWRDMQKTFMKEQMQMCSGCGGQNEDSVPCIYELLNAEPVRMDLKYGNEVDPGRKPIPKDRKGYFLSMPAGYMVMSDARRKDRGYHPHPLAGRPPPFGAPVIERLVNTDDEPFDSTGSGGAPGAPPGDAASRGKRPAEPGESSTAAGKRRAW